MGLEEKLPAGILLSTVEALAGYMRKASIWPATFGLACCAIEMMAVGTPDYDIARFGMERFSATPRQADLMIVAGRVSQKMAPVVRQVYDQMPEPKWVISMGVCASSGGMFNNYAIVQGVDSTTTRSSRASTTSCPSTSTCPAAPRGHRCCSTRSSCCTSRSRVCRSASTVRRPPARRKRLRCKRFRRPR